MKNGGNTPIQETMVFLCESAEYTAKHEQLARLQTRTWQIMNVMF